MKFNHMKIQARITAVVGFQDDDCGRNLMFF